MIHQLAIRLAKDETGGEVLETALVMGLLVMGCLGVMSALGVKFVEKWQTLADNLG